MLSITSIRQKDAERFYAEYFDAELRSRRLFGVSDWIGHPPEVLALDEYPALSTFRNLVNGLTTDGAKAAIPNAQDPDRVALWQLDMSGSQSLSVLWAMAPQKWQSIIGEAHRRAAQTVLECFQKSVAERNSSPEEKANPLGVAFSSAAAHDQTPHLKATGFVLTHGFLQDGSARNLQPPRDLDKQKRILGIIYDLLVMGDLHMQIGSFQRVPGMEEFRIHGVPQELVQRFFFDPKFSEEMRLRASHKDLAEVNLFALWKQEGQRFGWGERQASALIRQAIHRKSWADLKITLQTSSELLRQRASQVISRIRSSDHLHSRQRMKGSSNVQKETGGERHASKEEHKHSR